MSGKGNMKSFMKGAVLLTMAGLIVKLLSAVYRIPFQNLVGDRGFYIYQQVYPFIGIFATWTSYGFSVAVSKMLADTEEGEQQSVLRVAFGFIAAISLAVFLTLFFGASLLAEWMGDRELAPLLKAGSWAVLLMPLLAVLKGGFQANQQMAPVAYAQVSEQAVRVLIILSGTWIVVSQGASLYAAGQAAMWGTVAGEAAGVLLLLIYFKKLSVRQQQKERNFPVWPAVKKMAAVSMSVSMSALLLLFFQLVDSFTVFRILTESGVDRLTAMELKGVYDRGQPLVQFGLLIATSLALAVVPLVANMAKKTGGRPASIYAQLSFRVAFLFALAASIGLVLVMPYANETLFQTREGSAALAIFCLQIVWMSLLLVMTAILQGRGKTVIPALLLTAGLILKVVCNFLLIPSSGIIGAAIASNIGMAAAVAGLLVYFKKVWPLQFAPFRYYVWIALAAMLMSITVAGWSLLADGYLFDGLPGRASALLVTVTAVPLGAGLFLAVIARSRIISEKEWYFIPFGRRLAVLQLWLNPKRKR